MTTTCEVETLKVMIQQMTQTFVKAIEQQTVTIRSILEKKIDVLEHDVFNVKERMDCIQKENTALKENLRVVEKENEDLKSKLGLNRGAIIDLKQAELKNHLVAISSNSANPLNVPLKKLTGPTRHHTTAKGLHIFTYPFIDINDKIDFLKKKKELQESLKIKLFSPLCPELKQLLNMANELKEQGKINRAWIHRDRLYVSQADNDRFPIKCEFDIDFYK